MQTAPFTFKTKAANLESLQGRISRAQIPLLVRFSTREWRTSPKAILQKIQTLLPSRTVIIRSSTSQEDADTASHAGAFQSIAGVPSQSKNDLKEAIEQVIRSYGRFDDSDEVFVQEQILDIKMCGVVLTRDLDTQAPYHIINFDCSGRFDGITSGTIESSKTFVHYRYSDQSPADPDLRRVIELGEELHALTGNDALDIEFAISTTTGRLYLLQVRPIVQRVEHSSDTDVRLTGALHRVAKKLQKLNGPHPAIHGKTAIYSVMTDWNPAEIIGTRPRRLALSLYKELITDSIWAYQRSNYGYKNLRGSPLLVSLLGCPYMDVRASFNSFIPAELDEALTEKLADYYAERLKAAPTDHDKVEFKIVFSCYFINLAERLKGLLQFGFTELETDRIKFALLQLTNRIISPREGIYRLDLEKISILESKYRQVRESPLPLIDKIYWILEDCKRFGTLPFAGLARAGFIAVQFLRSFVEVGIISTSDLDIYLKSLNTVSKQLVHHSLAYHHGSLSKQLLLDRYGHLRPGTYDILSKRYDESFEIYFDKPFAELHRSEPSQDEFQFSELQRNQISYHLSQNGLKITAQELLSFVKSAIEGREYSKFVFTRSLSYALQLIEQLANKTGISREDASHLDIKVILDLYASVTSDDLPSILRRNIDQNKLEHEVTLSVKLPDLITSPTDVFSFFVNESEPNFVTQSRIIETVVSEDELEFADLSHRIVMIRSADPGYDWLFSRNIGGLITMYGGSNSHMAIRCAELQIPAAIGCGEKLFGELLIASKVELDCAAKQLRRVS